MYRKSKGEIHKEQREKYKGKPLHGQFRRATKEVRSKRSWDWLKNNYLRKETESTIAAAQDHSPYTRNKRNVVYRENFQSICLLCGVADEIVAHIVSECSKLAQKEYRQVTHDHVAKMLHWKLCEKWEFNNTEKWYIHRPQKVLESEDCNIL